jgi:hypothetical protein
MLNITLEAAETLNSRLDSLKDALAIIEKDARWCADGELSAIALRAEVCRYYLELNAFGTESHCPAHTLVFLHLLTAELDKIRSKVKEGITGQFEVRVLRAMSLYTDISKIIQE